MRMAAYARSGENCIAFAARPYGSPKWAIPISSVTVNCRASMPAALELEPAANTIQIAPQTIPRAAISELPRDIQANAYVATEDVVLGRIPADIPRCEIRVCRQLVEDICDRGRQSDIFPIRHRHKPRKFDSPADVP